MCVKICSLSSGSRGNSVFVGTEETKILIDDGLPLAYVEEGLRALDVRPAELDAILITHRHSDHIGGVGAFSRKYGTKVYVHHAEAGKIAEASRTPYSHVVDFFDGDFFLKDFTVSPFRVTHDVFCLGYSLYARGKKFSILTDLGKITDVIIQNVGDADTVMIEANHDDELLANNGNYSPWLKRRIKGTAGHLSNAECAEACAKIAAMGARSLILAHLSEENNYPELAASTVSGRLSREGIAEGRDVRIHVAKQHIMSPLFQIE